jgi:oxaloacetate decarboxylase gamma subunit
VAIIVLPLAVGPSTVIIFFISGQRYKKKVIYFCINGFFFLPLRKFVFIQKKDCIFMNIGITLMIVGMVTVFAVLLIIIFLSNQLIRIVNRVAPDEEAKSAVKTVKAVGAIAPDVMEAIRLTVAKITEGKGTVAEVKAV